MKKFVFAIISIFFSLIIVEVFARVVNALINNESILVTYTSQCLPDNKLNYVLNPSYKENGITHNLQGFRSLKEYHFNGKDTILCMGGSTTYGVGVSDKETFPYILSEILKCDVVNAGIPAHHSYHILLRLEELLKQIHPKYLILYIGHNDISFYLDTPKEWKENSTKVGSVAIQPDNKFVRYFRVIKNHSVTMNKISKLTILYLSYLKNRKNNLDRIYSLDSLKSEQINKRVIDNFRNNCMKIIEVCRKYKVIPVFVNQVYYLNPLNLETEWERERLNKTEYYISYPRFLFLMPEYFISIYIVFDELKNIYRSEIMVLPFNETFYKDVGYELRNKYFIDMLHLNYIGNNLLEARSY